MLGPCFHERQIIVQHHGSLQIQCDLTVEPGIKGNPALTLDGNISGDNMPGIVSSIEEQVGTGFQNNAGLAGTNRLTVDGVAQLKLPSGHVNCTIEILQSLG